MSEDSLSVENIELVHHMSKCVADLKAGLEGAEKMEAALFFTSMVAGDEVYAQPIVCPVEIANKLATAVIELGRMENEQFAKFLEATFFMYRLNHVRPAPMEMHFKFLEMFERMLHTGMHDKADEVAKLAELSAGDLVVMQMVLNQDDGEVISGLRIVKKPLLAHEAGKGMTLPDKVTVH